MDLSERRFVASKVRSAVLFTTITSMAAGVCFGLLAYSVSHAEEELDAALLRAVVREVKEHYVEEVPREMLVDNAIRGMLAGLDEHSLLLDERTLIALREDTAGAFGGVGLEIGLIDGHLTVIAPLPDTPAARAGIVAGDRLLEVDHRPVRRLADAAQALRGRPNTSVHVRVDRPATAVGASDGEAPDGGEAHSPAEETASPPAERRARNPLDFAITRAHINVPSARGRVLAPGYGYVRIGQFNDTTRDDLAALVADFAAKAPLKGLIVDLRDNPGGLLTTSVAVADAFLEQGVIVSIEGRLPEIAQRYEADAEDITGGAALAVLLNRGSASASEVVAAALQDHGRATVVGSRSYGKTSVQSVMHFNNKRAIKLTTARYVTPSGRALDDTGVTPDIAVPRQNGASAQDHYQRVVAVALAHLQEGTGNRKAGA